MFSTTILWLPFIGFTYCYLKQNNENTTANAFFFLQQYVTPENVQNMTVSSLQ